MSRSYTWFRSRWITAAVTLLAFLAITAGRSNAQILDPLSLLTCPGNLTQCTNNQNKCTSNLTSCLNTLSTCQSTLATIKPPAGTPGETRLLFPFMTNQDGFDTGLAISNTSMDPFGTVTETGSCTLTFYGAAAPTTPANTGTIAAGTTYASLVSVLAPGFQGYMIADCDFDFAHGFAFVSDVGAQKLAMGYLPLVLSDKTRTPTEALDQ
jgi:hypothetical protein